MLDVGCGTGFLSLLFAAQGIAQPVSIWLRGCLSGRAKRPPRRGRRSISSVEAPDLPAASHDLIVERHVIWTLRHPEAALDAWRQLLRRRGRLILIEGNGGPRSVATNTIKSTVGCRSLADGLQPKWLRWCARGFTPVSVEPLMNPELWTESPNASALLATDRA